MGVKEFTLVKYQVKLDSSKDKVVHTPYERERLEFLCDYHGVDTLYYSGDYGSTWSDVHVCDTYSSTDG